jgi:hypothetical protein
MSVRSCLPVGVYCRRIRSVEKKGGSPVIKTLRYSSPVVALSSMPLMVVHDTRAPTPIGNCKERSESVGGTERVTQAALGGHHSQSGVLSAGRLWSKGAQRTCNESAIAPTDRISLRNVHTCRRAVPLSVIETERPFTCVLIRHSCDHLDQIGRCFSQRGAFQEPSEIQ